jgi:hypothetical protein
VQIKVVVVLEVLLLVEVEVVDELLVLVEELLEVVVVDTRVVDVLVVVAKVVPRTARTLWSKFVMLTLYALPSMKLTSQKSLPTSGPTADAEP